jgi:hypothetical protein
LKALLVIGGFVLLLYVCWMIHPVLAIFVAILGYPAIDAIVSK